MPFDVFKLRDRVVGDYQRYFESFINIYDDLIREYVEQKLDEGTLWPDAELQLTDEDLNRDMERLLEEAALNEEQERKQVKRVARDLLNTLKAEKLVLDWRKGSSPAPTFVSSSKITSASCRIGTLRRSIKKMSRGPTSSSTVCTLI